jgi:ribosome-associated protein
MVEDVAGDLAVSRRLVIPADELRWRFSRSSGPGGQSVNTTDSRVELSWDAGTSRALTDEQLARVRERHASGVLTVSAADQRSQWQNRRAARSKLAALVRRAVAPPPAVRRATRPTRGAVQRRLDGKRRRGAIKRLRRSPDG